MKKTSEELIVRDPTSMAMHLQCDGPEVILSIGGVEAVVMTESEVAQLILILKNFLC